MSELMAFSKQLLDHGYIRLVDVWGRESLESEVGDAAIIAGARMSTGKSFLGWGPKHTSECESRRAETFRAYKGPPQDGVFVCECGGQAPGDEKLLRFLWENKHSTPFELCGLTVEVQAPIFVFREWHRHRVPFGYSEASARYSPLPDLNYVPTVERLMMNAGASNKQAGTVKDSDPLTRQWAEEFRQRLMSQYATAQALYEDALAWGVPKELARVHLPVGRYSKMRATANLRGWLGFITLRSAPNAQWEIRMYSDALAECLRQLFPRTMGLFDERH